MTARGKSVEEVMDPYDWLPGYGESSVGIRTSGSDLVVDIEYEELSEGRVSLWRSLVFRWSVYFVQSSLPAPVDLSNGGREGRSDEDPRSADRYKVPVSSLVVIDQSELADSWSRQLRQSKGYFQHFRIVFSFENILLEVVAHGFELSEPRSDRVS